MVIGDPKSSNPDCGRGKVFGEVSGVWDFLHKGLRVSIGDDLVRDKVFGEVSGVRDFLHRGLRISIGDIGSSDFGRGKVFGEAWVFRGFLQGFRGVRGV